MSSDAISNSADSSQDEVMRSAATDVNESTSTGNTNEDEGVNAHKRKFSEETSNADKDERAKSPVKGAKQFDSAPQDDDVKKAREAQLEKLKEEIKKDVNLPLASSMLVFGRGDATAEIVFIGEAPGENEELYGKPFTGPAGRLLNQLLADMGMKMDENTYVCNVLKYRPPENRDPTAKEVQYHTPYLLRQLYIICPKLIIPLGNWATKYVLSGFDPKKMNKIEGMVKVHGQKFVVNSPRGDVYNVIPAFHPAAALHNKQWEPSLRSDFHKIKAFIDSEEFKQKPSVAAGGGGGDAVSPMKKQKVSEGMYNVGGPKQHAITSFFTPKKK